MANDIDPTVLKKVTAELIDAIASKEFVAAMVKMKAVALEDRLAYASKTLTPKALEKQGVKFPKGMRITSRFFEPGSPDVIAITDYGAILNPAGPLPGWPPQPPMPNAGPWGCACGGAATVCGGAGGGS